VAEYEEHPSKASAWRDGRFVVLPEAEQAGSTVWAAVETESPDSVRWEGLLARRLPGERASVCSIPFWLYDLNLGDEVALMMSAEDEPVVTEVVADSGNHTFRVRFVDASSDDERWRELMVDLEPFECWFDVRSPGFLALSAPPAHAQGVADHLDRREQRGELLFETGRSAPAG
jgi:hypothetical protein